MSLYTLRRVARWRRPRVFALGKQNVVNLRAHVAFASNVFFHVFSLVRICSVCRSSCITSSRALYRAINWRVFRCCGIYSMWYNVAQKDVEPFNRTARQQFCGCWRCCRCCRHFCVDALNTPTLWFHSLYCGLQMRVASARLRRVICASRFTWQTNETTKARVSARARASGVANPCCVCAHCALVLRHSLTTYNTHKHTRRKVTGWSSSGHRQAAHARCSRVCRWFYFYIDVDGGRGGGDGVCSVAGITLPPVLHTSARSWHPFMRCEFVCVCVSVRWAPLAWYHLLAYLWRDMLCTNSGEFMCAKYASARAPAFCLFITARRAFVWSRRYEVLSVCVCAQVCLIRRTTFGCQLSTLRCPVPTCRFVAGSRSSSRRRRRADLSMDMCVMVVRSSTVCRVRELFSVAYHKNWKVSGFLNEIKRFWL